METRKTKLGADHPDTLSSMANLAATYSNQGRWEEAEKLQVQVMETRKTKLGADHPDTLTSMANLAVDVLESGPVEGGREAGGRGDGDEQDEARGRPSLHADEHGQPSVDVPEPRPMDGGREARRCR